MQIIGKTGCEVYKGSLYCPVNFSVNARMFFSKERKHCKVSKKNTSQKKNGKDKQFPYYMYYSVSKPVRKTSSRLAERSPL